MIGIVLTGMLQDGTVGMELIKRSGGITMVQKPEAAEYPDMPLGVLLENEVDYVVPIAEMGSLLEELVFVPASSVSEVPDDIAYEATIAERIMLASDEVEQIDILGARAP